MTIRLEGIGSVVLFAVAFPLGPLLGYLSNTIQMKFFGTALLNYYQRNMPYGVTNIGAFQTCFETVARFSIVTNSGQWFGPILGPVWW